MLPRGVAHESGGAERADDDASLHLTHDDSSGQVLVNSNVFASRVLSLPGLNSRNSQPGRLSKIYACLTREAAEAATRRAVASVPTTKR